MLRVNRATRRRPGLPGELGRGRLSRAHPRRGAGGSDPPGGAFVSYFQRVTASLFCVRAERPRSPGVLQEGQWLPRGTEQSVCQVSCSPEFLLTRCEIYVTLRRSSPVHTTMTQLAKLKAEISEDLRRLLRRAAEAGEVPPVEGPEVIWEYPSEPGFGDLATPVAFALARSARRRPRDIAESLRRHLDLDPQFVDRVEAGGGRDPESGRGAGGGKGGGSGGIGFRGWVLPTCPPQAPGHCRIAAAPPRPGSAIRRPGRGGRRRLPELFPDQGLLAAGDSGDPHRGGGVRSVSGWRRKEGSGRVCQRQPHRAAPRRTWSGCRGGGCPGESVGGCGIYRRAGVLRQ